MCCDALDGGQVVELKVLSPEDIVSLELTGGASVERVIQTKLAEVFLFGWQVLGLYDPQPQQILYPTAVVLWIEGDDRWGFSEVFKNKFANNTTETLKKRRRSK